MTNEQPILENGLENFLKKFNRVHPLSQKWNFFYLIPDKTGGRMWNEYLNQLHEIGSFEEFWAILSSITPANEIPKGCRYYIFKDGIKPVFEDKANTNGREICVEHTYPRFVKQDPKKKEKQTHMNQTLLFCAEKWEKLVVAIFCNNEKLIKNIEYINGIEFNHRSNIIKFGVWTRPIDDAIADSIQDDICKIIDFEEKPNVFYKKRAIMSLERIPEGERL